MDSKSSTKGSIVARAQAALGRVWRSFRALALWAQVLIGVALIALVGGLIVLSHGGTSADTAADVPTVMVASISSLSGGQSGVGIIGTVRSVAEANVVTQSGGTVTAIRTKIGANVAAGTVLASLDNESQAASVLQAQGAYDQAIAGRSASQIQSGNTQASLSEAQNAARDTFRSAYSSADSTIRNNVDVFFGGPTAVGPQLLISPLTSGDTLSRERRDISEMLDTWDNELPTIASADPQTLLNTAYSRLQQISTFLDDLSRVANDTTSGATPAQLANLATARAAINGSIASVSAARDSYRAKQTAANVADTQTVSSNATTASADASVKTALGGLRAAQAAYEKTLVRAPIAGTINFFTLHLGDYVNALTHVATVAHNNSLEVVAFVSQDQRNAVAVGDTVQIAEGSVRGIVTTVAPALDPVTKQIELDIAVTGDAALVDGQSVHITLPGDVQKHDLSASVATTTAASQNTLLPLTAVKLRASDRVIFTVGTDGRLVAHIVEIGDVIGDKIQITTPLSADLSIVTDARGLTEGQQVQIATSTPATQTTSAP